MRWVQTSIAGLDHDMGALLGCFDPIVRVKGSEFPIGNKNAGCLTCFHHNRSVDRQVSADSKKIAYPV